jgi:hypothetical protein
MDHEYPNGYRLICDVLDKPKSYVHDWNRHGMFFVPSLSKTTIKMLSNYNWCSDNLLFNELNEKPGSTLLSFSIFISKYDISWGSYVRLPQRSNQKNAKKGALWRVLSGFWCFYLNSRK